MLVTSDTNRSHPLPVDQCVCVTVCDYQNCVCACMWQCAGDHWQARSTLSWTSRTSTMGSWVCMWHVQQFEDCFICRGRSGCKERTIASHFEVTLYNAKGQWRVGLNTHQWLSVHCWLHCWSAYKALWFYTVAIFTTYLAVISQWYRWSWMKISCRQTSEG